MFRMLLTRLRSSKVRRGMSGGVTEIHARVMTTLEK